MVGLSLSSPDLASNDDSPCPRGLQAERKGGASVCRVQESIQDAALLLKKSSQLLENLFYFRKGTAG